MFRYSKTVRQVMPVFGLLLALVVVGCGPAPEDDDDGTPGGAGTSTPTWETESGASTGTTTPGGPETPTLGDEPSPTPDNDPSETLAPGVSPTPNDPTPFPQTPVPPVPNEVPPADGVIRSSFDSSAEGWVVWQAGAIGLRPSDGAAGAYVYTTSTSYSGGYWVAPQAYVGNRLDAWGQKLSFSLRVQASSTSSDADVWLMSSRGERLRFSFANNPTTNWAAFEVELRAGQGWIVDSTNKAATDQDMRRVLSDLSQLRISIGAGSSNIRCELDEVKLGTSGHTELPTSPTASVTSTFNGNTLGWTTWEGSDINWRSDDGGEYVTTLSDSYNNTFWVAPPTFLGPQDTAYGGNLIFQRRVEDDGDASGNDVYLWSTRGDGIAFRFPFGTASSWTRFVAPLQAGAGWKRVDDNTPATEEDIRSILADVGQLRIYSDADASNMICDLDNVVLERFDESDELPSESYSIRSTFAAGSERWSTLGMDLPYWSGGDSPYGGRVLATTPSYQGSWWIAPPAFTGDVSDAYLHTLSFMRRRSDTGNSPSFDVCLLSASGDEICWYRPDGYSTPADWATFVVPLDDFIPGWIDTHTDKEAGSAVFDAVLSDLSVMAIYTDADSSNETVELDEVVLGLSRAPTTPTPPETLTSATFDKDTQGWTLSSGGPVSWDPDGGVNGSDGALVATSTCGSSSWWVAPAGFHGDFVTGYGGSLVFWRWVSYGSPSTYDDVEISGAGRTLRWQASFSSATGWLRFRVPLDEREGWEDLGTGDSVDGTVFRQVLANITDLRIHSDAGGSGRSCGLDQVWIESAG